jgi:hypothetical protein
MASTQWDKRYLCLFGCSFDIEHYRREWQPMFEEFKVRHFGGDPEDPVILHREDVKAKRGPFSVLMDKTKCDTFNQELLELTDKAPFRGFAVVIDKLSIGNKDFGPISAHPYHVGMLALLERYCGWLKFGRLTGDVLAEARGGREDEQLKSAYIAIHSGGTRFYPSGFFKQTLTTGEIKIKPKAQNIAALQLADMLAYPAKRRILSDWNLAPPLIGFGKELAETIEKKYNRRFANDQVFGYGKILIT